MNTRQRVIRALLEAGASAKWHTTTEFEQYYIIVNNAPARRQVREVVGQLEREGLLERFTYEDNSDGRRRILVQERHGFQIRDRAALVREFYGYLTELESDLLQSTLIALGSFLGLLVAYIVTSSPLVVLVEVFVSGWLFASTLHCWRSLESQGYGAIEFLHALIHRAGGLRKHFPYKRQRSSELH